MPVTLPAAIEAPSRVEVGRALATARTRVGLSTYEVARYLRVTRKTVSTWESGRTSPPADLYLAALALYGVDLPTVAPRLGEADSHSARNGQHRRRRRRMPDI